LELYGAAVGEYAEHLERLRQTLRKHPDDPVLLFLLGYQLWFDGRKEEARPLFRRALPRAADRAAIERFLRALPPVEL
jgi:Flp pilus assembly protein TadD